MDNWIAKFIILQNTCILLKYCPASKGITLYVEIPVIGVSVGFLAV